MANPDFLNIEDRLRVIKQIESEENYSRKREAQRRYDVFRRKQDKYILEKLREEFEETTVREMRKILSMNMTEKIMKELSSIYDKEPEREFPGSTEREKEQLKNLYKFSMANSKLKKSNRFYNLFDQNDIYIIPKDGKIQIKPLTLMSYDVVPDESDPEKAFAYILNSWDEGAHASATRTSESGLRQNYYNRDFMNQKIADPDDRKALSNRYIVWTKEHHFTMNGKGRVIGEIIDNPIGMLPFVNVALDKDDSFFVDRGSDVVDFDTEFSVCLSDLANNIKMQGYAQAVVTAEKAPSNLKVGVNHVIFLQANKNSTIQPKFEFVSPTPDIGSSIQFLEMLLSLMLSSRDIDPKEITTRGDGKQFNSGFERLLAMLDRFEASQDDLALYRWAEKQIFDIMVAWSNLWQSVSDESALIPELKVGTIKDSVDIDVVFKGPEATKTESEDLDIVERRLDRQLISRKKAIMRLDDVEEDMAVEILEEIDQEESDSIEKLSGSNPFDSEDDDAESAESKDEQGKSDDQS